MSRFKSLNVSLLFVVVAVALSSLSLAGIEVYEFKDAELERRFQEITSNLRCPKCQNQNIADSDAPLANDLKAQVYRMLIDGESDEAIYDYMWQRYGDFVLYKPKLSGKTAFIWIFPLLFFVVAVAVVILVVRSNRVVVNAGHDTGASHSESTLTVEDAKRLSGILQQASESKPQNNDGDKN